MSDKVYGAKCFRCGCVEHRGSEGLDVEPIPWLTEITCERCLFCQEHALSNMIITHGGMDLFDPEVRAAVKAFSDRKPHPLLDQLRWECAVLGQTVTVLDESWTVADAQHDGQHVHLTLTRGSGGASDRAERNAE